MAIRSGTSNAYGMMMENVFEKHKIERPRMLK